MNQTELAYFAGFFDGEGCVAIYPKKYIVSLSNTVPGSLCRAQEIWGGAVCSQHREPHQRIWRWQIYGHESARFLADVRPYLIVKAEQVDLYMTAIAVMRPGGRRFAPGAAERIAQVSQRLKQIKKGK